MQFTFLQKPVNEVLPESFTILNIPKSGHIYVGGFDDVTDLIKTGLNSFSGSMYSIRIKVSNHNGKHCVKQSDEAMEEAWADLLHDEGTKYY